MVPIVPLNNPTLKLFVRGTQRQIDDNWLLRQNPDYSEVRRRRRTGPRSLEGIEIEISREDDDDGDDEANGAAGNVGVVRIHRLLRQTNDMLERLQCDLESSLRQELNARRKKVGSSDDDDVDDGSSEEQVGAIEDFFHLLPKPRTYFYACIKDGEAWIFFPPMPRPGIKFTSVLLILF